MKNVVFLIGNLNSSGGTERVTSLIANEVVNYPNYNILVLSLIDGLEPFFKLDKNISIYSLYKDKISFKRNFLGVILKIRKFVQENKIDTLIVVDSISCIFSIPALYGLNIKHICWEHFNFKNDNGIYFRKIARTWAAKYCDYVVTLTKRDKSFWEKGIKKINAKIISIPNPTILTESKSTASLSYKVVLAVGRLVDVKGFDLLIRAWEGVSQREKDWVLRIVGSGEQEENLKKIVEKKQMQLKVEFIPSTPDINEYYRKASLYCLSSRFEGFPMVLLEAQSFGLPIVAFDCDTGPAEIIEQNLNGLLVQTGDISQLENALLTLINLNSVEYKKMSSHAFKSSHRYSIQSVAKEWLFII